MARDLTALPESRIDAARYQEVLDEDILAAIAFWVSFARSTRIRNILEARVDDVRRQGRLGSL